MAWVGGGTSGLTRKNLLNLRPRVGGGARNQVNKKHKKKKKSIYETPELACGVYGGAKLRVKFSIRGLG